MKLIGPSITTPSANGKAGARQIDPTDFTLAASDGDETDAALTAALDPFTGGNITIQSSQGANSAHGDININDAGSWNWYTLALDAVRNVNVNAVMTVTYTRRFVGIVGDASHTGLGSSSVALLYWLGKAGFIGLFHGLLD